MSTAIAGTLGYHRDMSAAVFGADSAATKYLDEKIAAQGRDEPVIVDEGQLLFLLVDLHLKGLIDQKLQAKEDAAKHNGN